VADIVRHIELVAADPVRLPGGDMSGTCSIGVAVFPRDGHDAETLIHNADTAMYQSKRDGRARSCFFTPAMQHEAEQRVRLEARLRKAIEAQDFQLVYQPIYTFDGALCGTEALIRWPQPGGTVVAPNVFIPYAEACGLIIPIGTWVLRTACRQNAAWNLRAPNLCMSVNVSAKQLADPHFVRTVRRALLDSGLAPELLELELTETAMSTNAERTTAVIEELRGFGVRVAIDDFGTGYNTLATLRSNVVDTLKLDICFVTGIATSAVDQAIASTVITAAHGLGAKVVAEGVETLPQRAMLAKLECDAAQGFLFARPMSPAEFDVLLSADEHGSRSTRLGHLLERTG
jgi:EAL domain-containing protein (putative c-di-GMP-specific phosphodiesterase class I)